MPTTKNEDFTPESKTYTSQGLTLHYLDWGNAHLPPLILLHGIQDHARSWDGVAAALSDHWHVIAPDLRGHGDSQWSPDGAYLPPYLLLDLVELVDSLGCDKVSLLAHSFGGNAAARFSALYPDRVNKLVLVDAMGPPQTAIDMWQKEGVVKRTRDWLERRRIARNKSKRLASVEEAAERLKKGNTRLSPEQALHLASHGVRQDNGAFVWKHDPVLGNFLPEDFAIHLSEFWKEITAPTLICWGTEAWTPNPATDGSSDHFSNVVNATFEGAAHWLHHDQLEEFVNQVREFLG